MDYWQMSNRISWCHEVYVKFQSKYILLFIFVKKRRVFLKNLICGFLQKVFFYTNRSESVFPSTERSCSTMSIRSRTILRRVWVGLFESRFIQLFCLWVKIWFFTPNDWSTFLEFFSIFFYFKIRVVGICLTHSKT